MSASCFEPAVRRTGKRRARQGFVLLAAAAITIVVLLPAIGQRFRNVPEFARLIR